MKRINAFLLSILLLLAIPGYPGNNEKNSPSKEAAVPAAQQVKVFPTMVVGTVYNYFEE